MIENNGKKYARVSEVLDHLFDKSKIKESVLQNKQEIGTETHLAIQNFLENEIPLVDEKSAPYFLSFQHWYKSTNIKVLSLEERFFSDGLRLTGQVDMICQFPYDPLPIIVDFKTCATKSSNWVLQGHLYHALASQNGKAIGDRFIFLKLDKSGKRAKAYEYQLDKITMAHAINLVSSFWDKFTENS